MAAIGSVWAQPSWADDVWADGTWANQGAIITGTFDVETGAPVGTFRGRAAKFGGTTTGPSIFERRQPRHRDPEGVFQVERGARQMVWRGAVTPPALAVFIVGGHRRFIRVAGWVDRTPLIEEEAFLLGLLLGDDA